MKIIGRKRERDELNQCILSKRPEFVAVYGRRRVGKTYLIKEFFNKQFAKLKSFTKNVISNKIKTYMSQ